MASPAAPIGGPAGERVRDRQRLGEAQRDVHLVERRARADEDCAASALELAATLADGADEDDLASEGTGRERLGHGLRRGVDDQDVRALVIHQHQSRVNVGNGADDHDVVIRAERPSERLAVKQNLAEQDQAARQPVVRRRLVAIVFRLEPASRSGATGIRKSITLAVSCCPHLPTFMR